MVTKPAKPVKTVKISRPTKSTLKQSTKPTLRKSASPRQTLSKSLGAVASNKWMKKADAKWTMSEQRNRYYNAMVNADKALDRVNRAWTNKNERAYAEQAYFKAKDMMKAAAKQYNSIKKRLKK